MAVTPGMPSGTTNYGVPPNGPAISELVLDAYERCGKIGVELTSQYLQSARRSLNLVRSSWANRGPNLWTVQLFTQTMPQGVGKYIFPPEIIDILPDSMVVRQYQMGSPVAVTPQFTTSLNSTSVIVAGLAATPAAGQYISVGTVTSVGGILIDGFYQVVAVPGSGQAEITASAAATVPVTAGGVVPQFSTTANSTTVTVVLPNHGLLVGQPFTVEIQTSVGGLSLLGPYAATSIVDANTFTITSPYPAGFVDTEFENGGNVNLATQATIQGTTETAYPVDIIMYPLSRGDWEAIPLKKTQGRPTSVWINRQISPEVHVWPEPNATGPYELRCWATTQVQDADITNGQCLNVPMRFVEAFTADLAARLAVKWSPDRAAGLKTLAAEEWQMAADEDRERVSTFISGDLSQYYD